MRRLGTPALGLLLALVLVPVATANGADVPSGPTLGTVVGPPPVASPAAGLVVTSDGPVSREVLADVEEILGEDVVGQAPVGESEVAIRTDGTLPAAKVERLSAKLSALPEISRVEPNLVATPDQTPNDKYFPQQVNLFAPSTGSSGSGSTGDGTEDAGTGSGTYAIDAPSLWRSTTGRKDVVVAVVDGGLVKHTDLSGQTVAGYDMVSDKNLALDGNGRDSDASDPGNYSSGKYCVKHDSTWHGTHVAGIIGARSNNKDGIAGVASGVTLQPVRAVGACGGTMSDIADGIRWASGAKVDGLPVNKTPAKVINVSLSSTVTDYTCPVTYQSAVDEARSRGALVVVSAGNQGQNVLSRTPSNCAGVLSVGAVAPDGSPTTYTNAGLTLGMVAPGGVDPGVAKGQGIWSTVDTGSSKPKKSSYGQLSGTSMAAPAVSGAAALLFSLGDFTADEVVSMLKASAVKPPRKSGYYTCLSDHPVTGVERSVCGAGILNLAGIPAPIGSGTLAGSATIGGTLTFTPGAWSGQPESIAHEWLRDGVPFEVVDDTYVVTADDIGRTFAVRSTSHTTGYSDFSTTTPGRAVPKASSSVALTLTPTKASRKKTVVTARAVVTVGQGQPTTGTVTILVKGSKVATAEVVDGVAEVALPLFTKSGTFEVQATFAGASTVLPASSGKVKIKVS